MYILLTAIHLQGIASGDITAFSDGYRIRTALFIKAGRNQADVFTVHIQLSALWCININLIAAAACSNGITADRRGICIIGSCFHLDIDICHFVSDLDILCDRLISFCFAGHLVDPIRQIYDFAVIRIRSVDRQICR